MCEEVAKSTKNIWFGLFSGKKRDRTQKEKHNANSIS